MVRVTLIVSILAFTVLTIGGAGSSEEKTGKAFVAVHYPKTGHSLKQDLSIPIRDMPQEGDYPSSILESGKRIASEYGSVTTEGFISDPVAQQSDTNAGTQATSEAPSTRWRWGGIHMLDNIQPPDPSGAVGPNHFFEATSHSFAIFSRNGTQIDLRRINVLWRNFGGPCETAMNGDPIALYDRRAGRWVITQRAAPNYPSGPFFQCFAISKTSDPTGAFHRYQFKLSDTLSNEEGKLAIWSNGYYLATTQYSMPAKSFHSSGVLVFERVKMLRGESARVIRFDVPNARNLLPLDLDGSRLPPLNTEYFVNLESGQLRFWKFQTNWTTPSNSRFSSLATIKVAPFDSSFECGSSGNACIPQRNTDVKVDVVAGRLMFRAAYRNFGTHEAIVLNHTVRVGGSRAGIRWYEVRNINTKPFLYQQGTYAPEGLHRWMGSIAMDRYSNIFLAYNASSAEEYPSIRYVSRKAADARGVMSSGEQLLVQGTGSLSDISSRWGDHSIMTVDHADDCTVWHINEYLKSVTDKWYTYIGSMRYPSCLTADTTVPAVKITSPANGSNVSGTIVLQADATDASGIAKVEFYRDSGILLATSHIPPYKYAWNTGSVPAGTHKLFARAYDMAGNKSTSAVITVTTGSSDGGGGSCTQITQILRNPGFERGRIGWTTSPLDIINNANSVYLPRRGSWKATLNGKGRSNTAVLRQQVQVPSNACSADFIFWLHVSTTETATTARDTLRVQILNSSGGVLAVPKRFSNLNQSGTYVRHRVNLLAYRGKTIELRFVGVENASAKTAFLLDDVLVRITK